MCIRDRNTPNTLNKNIITTALIYIIIIAQKLLRANDCNKSRAVFQRKQFNLNNKQFIHIVANQIETIIKECL